MTRRRWIADQVAGDRAVLLGAQAGHLARVLRARVGQEFEIAAGGKVRLGRIAAVNAERVEFELGEEVAKASSGAGVSLLLAVFKFDRMEWALEKAVELGAGRIVPVIARRTDAHLSSAAGKRVERWQRIAREAAQQSRRVGTPEIGTPLKLKDAVAGENGLRIVLAESERGRMLRDVLRENASASDIVLAIGPEGGWTVEELNLFAENGWIAASLGPTILRAETAAIAALAVVMAG